MKRKIFAALLALVMVVTILPLGIAAADVTVDTAAELADAIAAAADGDTITIADDIEISTAITSTKSITLLGADAGVVIDSTATDLFIVTAGTLTLGANITIESDTSILWAKGGTIIVDGAVLNANSPKHDAAYASNNGTIVVKAGSINSTGKDKVTLVAEGANITVEGGTVSNDSSSAIAALANSTVTISGGKVVTTASAMLAAAYAEGENAVINATGGTIAKENEANPSAALIAVVGGKVVVDGATIDGDILAWRGTGSTAEIKSGIINGYVSAADEASSVVISGGEYDRDVTDKYIVEGKVDKEVSGTWYVVKEGASKVTFDAGKGKLIGSASKELEFGDAYGKLPTATKVGYDFIGWFTEDGDYVDADDIFMSEEAVTLIAVYDANELGDTNNFPRLFPLNLEWNEGGSITAKGSMGRKNLIIAFAAKRTLDIVPEEGYEIVNVNVNGYDLGAVDQYTIVSAHMAYNVTATFAPKLVEVFTPVYTENFDGETKWTKGGHMDSIAVADGVLNATSTGGDPNINYPEAFGLNCDEIDAIRVKFTNNTENTAFQIFFTNEANPGYSEAGSFKATSVVGENELVIYTAGNDLWTGTLSNMRIDLSNGAGSYIVDSITFDTVTMEVAK